MIRITVEADTPEQTRMNMGRILSIMKASGLTLTQRNDGHCRSYAELEPYTLPGLQYQQNHPDLGTWDIDPGDLTIPERT